MFNLGMTEILVLGSLALIVIGPQQMPEVARSVARILNEFKRATGDLTSSLSRVRNETRESIQKVVDQATGDVESSFDIIKRMASETEGKIHQVLKNDEEDKKSPLTSQESSEIKETGEDSSLSSKVYQDKEGHERKS